jgi:DNA-binding NarL/FixJ family response regulator
MTDAPLDPTTAASTPRILLVDADERVRESLVGLLVIGRRCAVVGSSGSPSVALALVHDVAADVVVVDPRLPTLAEGRAFIDRLRQTAPDVRVVVLAPSPTTIDEDLRERADAFVRKTFRPRELLDAICAVVTEPVSRAEHDRNGRAGGLALDRQPSSVRRPSPANATPPTT